MESQATLGSLEIRNDKVIDPKESGKLVLDGFAVTGIAAEEKNTVGSLASSDYVDGRLELMRGEMRNEMDRREKRLRDRLERLELTLWQLLAGTNSLYVVSNVDIVAPNLANFAGRYETVNQCLKKIQESPDSDTTALILVFNSEGAHRENIKIHSLPDNYKLTILAYGKTRFCGNAGSPVFSIQTNLSDVVELFGDIDGEKKAAGLSVTGGKVILRGDIYDCNNEDNDGNGGGIYVTEAGVVTVWGDLANCSSKNLGGGVYVNGSTATIKGNILGCSSSQGGGVSAYDGKITVEGSILRCSGGHGGGVHIYYNGNITIEHDVIDCSARIQGGGVRIVDGDVTIKGSVRGCFAEYGGGLYTEVNSSSITIKGDIRQCSSERNGGGVYAEMGHIKIAGQIVGCHAGANYHGGGVYRKYESAVVMVRGGVSDCTPDQEYPSGVSGRLY